MDNDNKDLFDDELLGDEQFDFILDNGEESNDINTSPLSTHELIMMKLIEYSQWNERFERYGFVHSARMARLALMDIYHLVKRRRSEISDRTKFIEKYKVARKRK